ncbi:hypothetical protein HID58_016841 [Brassica napus]|uniref:Uncharacterized protein n=1 Tax=Brassica napus TaxID=3708 RepID=A0ABQ8D5E9_BRANA|nr:hypothetical protein HID58_016841 [Brassica napus]
MSFQNTSLDPKSNFPSFAAMSLRRSILGLHRQTHNLSLSKSSPFPITNISSPSAAVIGREISSTPFSLTQKLKPDSVNLVADRSLGQSQLARLPASRGYSNASLVRKIPVLFHINAGMEEVLADYVHQELTRNLMLTTLNVENDRHHQSISSNIFTFINRPSQLTRSPLIHHRSRLRRQIGQRRERRRRRKRLQIRRRRRRSRREVHSHDVALAPRPPDRERDALRAPVASARLPPLVLTLLGAVVKRAVAVFVVGTPLDGGVEAGDAAFEDAAEYSVGGGHRLVFEIQAEINKERI